MPTSTQYSGSFIDTPGVYAFTKDPSVRSVSGVSTSTAAFVGQPESNSGSLSGPEMILNFKQYTEKFGEFGSSGDNKLAWSVYLYFVNGGSKCYVVPTSSGSPTQTELERLDPLDDISLLVCPGVEGETDETPLTYATAREHKDLFYIGGVAQSPGDHTVLDSATASSFAAYYHPWLEVEQRQADGSTVSATIPPMGAVAGIYARTDGRRGVFKAPAGLQAQVRGIKGLTTNFSDAQQANYNGANINILRAFDGVGNVVWGARTHGSQSPWRYVPVRRTAMFLRLSLFRGTRFAVFEPNDEDLWQALRLTVKSFMHAQFQRGAFQGRSAKQAYFVQCDGETTTQTDIDNGVVNVRVGFAPLKPAEFVVITLEQITGGGV
ncbi:MAG: phage tail sheath family protein [Myxococcota bacterium]